MEEKARKTKDRIESFRFRCLYCWERITFVSLTQEEQKFANIFLHDIQSGDVKLKDGKTFRDYITEYLSRTKDDQIHRLAIKNFV